MLLDVLIQSVNEFQADCMKLCEKHYPTIHNKGMSEQHLGIAFARRLSRTLNEFGHQCEYQFIEILTSNADNPHHFRVSSDIGTVWILTGHLVNANATYRNKLLKAVAAWQNEYSFAIQPNDLLLLLSDHWITRSKQSRELLHWWTGRLPDEIDEYNAQGISLYESDSHLSNTLEAQFGLCPYYVKFTHPLKRSNNQQLVRKYIQLYSVVQLS
ncbi:hypothetical protein SAMN04488136_10667 [Vibrio xiamenensis]|uniref:Uncharacterized protein n=1 Tax=Vibrio xiamenensis TaxID=861298 RepID=A0A1G7YUU0_9VIBR|nr:hypothetical protein [Vibrio xiamenensis]SDH00283.1 hypothetical protein SAMN04488136_10667 [Vibrio xiamenensis]